MKKNQNYLLIVTAIFFVVSTEYASSKTFSIPEAKIKIIIEKGDITKSHVEVIVNAANEQLAGGAGVCGAIFKAAGWDDLQDACNAYPEISKGVRCRVGQAKITNSFNLKKLGINYIIHAVGPDCRIIKNTAQQYEFLSGAYDNSLLLAAQHQAKSIAFPFISSAIYACPKRQAALVAVQSAYYFIRHNSQTSLQSIHFVLFSQEDFDLFCSVTQEIVNPTLLQAFIQKLKKYFNWV